jgi:hypothetical protein
VGGTTTSCEGEWNSGNNGKDRVSQKYQELSERQEKGNIITLCDFKNIHYKPLSGSCLIAIYSNI